jgi:nucleoside-diphosphate kinase
MSVEHTLVIIKPDAVVRRQAGVEIIKAILRLDDVRVMIFSATKIDIEMAELHYSEHRTKPFFARITQALTHPSGVLVFILRGVNVVKRVRDLVGPAMVGTVESNSAESSLRRRFGIIYGINSVHASASVEDARREINIWEPLIFYQQPMEYVIKWDGKYVDQSEKIQKSCQRIVSLQTQPGSDQRGMLTELAELKCLLLNATNSDSCSVDKLIQDIVAAITHYE